MGLFKFIVVVLNLYLLFCCILPKKGLFFIADEENRKRIYAIIAYIGFLFLFGGLYSLTDEAKEEARVQALNAAKCTAGTPEWYRIRIDSARIDSVKLSSVNTDTIDIENMELAQVIALAQICKVHYANPKKEELDNDTLLSLYAFNRKQCTRIFNSCEKRLRKRFSEVCGSMLWDNNVEVEVTGKNCDHLWFTGGMFASNKNKRRMQETIGENVKLLGFKKVSYKWYKYDDEYTTWTIE